jgi:hypothetical protein
MPSLTSERRGLFPRSGGDGWGERYGLSRREEPGLSPGLLVAGLVAVGLGALAWHFLGPDLRRYMKIRNM